MRAVADELRAEVERAGAALRRLTDQEAGQERGAGRWVKKEILGHLIDSAFNNQQRFVRAQLESPFVGPGYDQRGWVAVQRYRDRPWLELVETWQVANRHLAATIAALPVDRLQNPCRVGEQPTAPLEWWVRDYVQHLRHHLAQLHGG